MGHYFVHYKSEFVITVIIITEFDCISIKQKGIMHNFSGFEGQIESFAGHILPSGHMLCISDLDQDS